jgi:hypothetical protein
VIAGGVRPAEVISSRPGFPYILPYQQGEAFSYWFRLENDGRWGVTVTAVDPGAVGQPGGLYEITAIRISTGPANPHRYPSTSFTPFHAFSLPGGGARDIEVDAVFRGCSNYEPGGSAVHEPVERIAYRVLGIPRHASVGTGQTIVVPAPDADGCPEPGRRSSWRNCSPGQKI